MEEVKQSVLGSLGVNWKLFVAQLVNFGIVLFVLSKWVFGPLMRTIEERKARTEKGLRDAEEAAAAKARAESEYETTVSAARREAGRIIEEAAAAAEKLRAEMGESAKSDVARIVGEARTRLAEEKDRIVREAKKDVADLVIASTEKVLSGLMDPKRDKAAIEQAVKKLV